VRGFETPEKEVEIGGAFFDGGDGVGGGLKPGVGDLGEDFGENLGQQDVFPDFGERGLGFLGHDFPVVVEVHGCAVVD